MDSHFTRFLGVQETAKMTNKKYLTKTNEKKKEFDLNHMKTKDNQHSLGMQWEEDLKKIK